MKKIFLQIAGVIVSAIPSSIWSADSALVETLKSAGYTVSQELYQVTVLPDAAHPKTAFALITCIHATTVHKWRLPESAIKLLENKGYTFPENFDSLTLTHIKRITPPISLPLTSPQEGSDSEDSLQFDLEL